MQSNLHSEAKRKLSRKLAVMYNILEMELLAMMNPDSYI